ncbi:mitochondrial outer membrane protein SLC25A46-like [Adelges cooleyi]|uniref:mitochondrial outer membrane protein SLC25A46-like n=1 Tax=Adelges cooleyi TaxID=133065 RepID=UPI00217F79B2|nr:mitochondrial outer membrane protein SLC25A46-like [Adelges cooleyi]
MAGLESFDSTYQRHRLSRSVTENSSVNLRRDNDSTSIENTRQLHLETLLEMSKNKDIIVNDTVNKCLKPTCVILQHVVSYPFIVLRRQCQLHYASNRYHIVPFTLIPVVFRLVKSQGVAVLWKGFGTVLLIKGMTMAVEAFLSELFDWPKDLSSVSSSKSFGKHILLKCASLSLITPFYSACLVETVQSNIASERTAFYDVFKEGFMRLLQWNCPQKGRMLPVWILVVPTVTYGVLRYVSNIIISKSIKHSLSKYELHKLRQTGAIPKDSSTYDNERLEAVSDLSASAISDAVLYPLETIMHRLYLQGTRTIIDNLDTGLSVMPILTGYVGPFDCFVTTVAQEGRSGLFKGFGALLLQTTVIGVLYKVTKLSLEKIVDAYATANSPPVDNIQNNQNITPEQSRGEPSNLRPVVRSTSFKM